MDSYLKIPIGLCVKGVRGDQHSGCSDWQTNNSKSIPSCEEGIGTSFLEEQDGENLQRYAANHQVHVPKQLLQWMRIWFVIMTIFNIFFFGFKKFATRPKQKVGGISPILKAAA
jgi:hypothetical protein